jgi:hypothetical protein
VPRNEPETERWRGSAWQRRRREDGDGWCLGYHRRRRVGSLLTTSRLHLPAAEVYSGGGGDAEECREQTDKASVWQKRRAQRSIVLRSVLWKATE